MNVKVKYHEYEYTSLLLMSVQGHVNPFESHKPYDLIINLNIFLPPSLPKFRKWSLTFFQFFFLIFYTFHMIIKYSINLPVFIYSNNFCEDYAQILCVLLNI